MTLRQLLEETDLLDTTGPLDIPIAGIGYDRSQAATRTAVRS